MTSTLRSAAHNTGKILSLANGAAALLLNNRARANAAGILDDPAATLSDLIAARKLIDEAIDIYHATPWPDPGDYHAL
jgi:hypothetical protein